MSKPILLFTEQMIQSALSRRFEELQSQEELDFFNQVKYEWCQDIWHADLTNTGTHLHYVNIRVWRLFVWKDNFSPDASDYTSDRVVRGGAYGNWSRYSRSAARACQVRQPRPSPGGGQEQDWFPINQSCLVKFSVK